MIKHTQYDVAFMEKKFQKNHNLLTQILIGPPHQIFLVAFHPKGNKNNKNVMISKKVTSPCIIPPLQIV